MKDQNILSTAARDPQDRLLEYLITALVVKVGGERRILVHDIVWTGGLQAAFDNKTQEYVLFADTSPPTDANVN